MNRNLFISKASLPKRLIAEPIEAKEPVEATHEQRLNDIEVLLLELFYRRGSDVFIREDANLLDHANVTQAYDNIRERFDQQLRDLMNS